MCGHKAIEIAAVCVLLMVQGDLAGVTLTHLAIAGKTSDHLPIAAVKASPVR